MSDDGRGWTIRKATPRTTQPFDSRQASIIGPNTEVEHVVPEARAERAERAADALRQELEQAHDLMNALSAVPITARGEDFDPLIRRARDLLAEHGEKGDDGVD